MRHDRPAFGDEAHICELGIAHQRTEISGQCGGRQLKVAHPRGCVAAQRGLGGTHKAQEAVAQDLQTRHAQGLAHPC
jgi:hypothetical protein